MRWYWNKIVGAVRIPIMNRRLRRAFDWEKVAEHTKEISPTEGRRGSEFTSGRFTGRV
jgi:hypothetical protein